MLQLSPVRADISFERYFDGMPHIPRVWDGLTPGRQAEHKELKLSQRTNKTGE